MENQNMTTTPKDRQMRREYAFYRFADFIDSWDTKRGKGAVYRRDLKCFLQIWARMDEAKETHIDCFGRGIWDWAKMYKAFTEREIEECIKPLARAYGAFDC